jgi:hypothetical protein
MLTDSSFIHSGSGFRLKLKSVAQMGLNRQCLLEDESERSLLEKLTASDNSSCSDDDDSSGTDILTIVEVTGSECSDSENEDMQYATVSTWEDMTNTTNRKEGEANKRVCSVL